MSFDAIDPFDFNAPTEEERQTQKRRQFTYSLKALEAATRLDRIFISHAGAKNALEAMDRVYQLGRALSLPQGMRIVGPPGCGKTTLLRYFQKSLPNSDLIEPGCQALLLRLQKRPYPGRIISSLLRQIRYPLPDTSEKSVGIKTGILIDALRHKGTRSLLIDEGHHLCFARRSLETSFSGNQITDLLRELMDSVPLGLVIAGSEQLDELAEFDQYLASRTTVRLALLDHANDNTWAGIVTAIINQLSDVDLTMLLAKAERGRLHTATGGNLRSLKLLLAEAVLIAIDGNQREATHQVMSLAFDRVSGQDSLRVNPYRK